jgi:hypothetical protein
MLNRASSLVCALVGLAGIFFSLEYLGILRHTPLFALGLYTISLIALKEGVVRVIKS